MKQAVPPPPRLPSERTSWPASGPAKWILGVVTVLVVSGIQAAITVAVQSGALQAQFQDLKERVARIEDKVDRLYAARKYQREE